MNRKTQHLVACCNNRISRRHLDADAEQLWIDEAQARHDTFLNGGLEVPGDEVMDRLGNVFSLGYRFLPPSGEETEASFFNRQSQMGRRALRFTRLLPFL